MIDSELRCVWGCLRPSSLGPSRLLGAPAAHINGDMCECDGGEMSRVSGTSHGCLNSESII